MPPPISDSILFSRMLNPSFHPDELPPSIYGPRSFEDELLYEKEDEIQAVVAKIEKFYSDAKLDKVAMDSGYCCCLGLLDPIANIRVNGVIYNNAAAAAAAEAAPPAPAPVKGSPEGIARRSLDGLVAFLTCIFPYLQDAEAVRYLAAAVEAALRCAAVAAEHPDPRRLVLGWRSLSVSASLTELASDGDPSAFMNRAALLILTPRDGSDLELREPWELARRRLASQHEQQLIRHDLLPPARAAMKRMLLAKIHRFYLTALGSLPQHELTERLHHSMLMAGSCYGPLDPVSNIIVNTVWHDQNFPASKGVKVAKQSMISTECLWRAAARSLYGLVSFLCTRYPSLTPDQALQRLLETEANLQEADPYLFALPEGDSKKMNGSGSLKIGLGKPDDADDHRQCRELEETEPAVTVQEAYAAAATAAMHPNPLAQKAFLGSPDIVANLRAVSRVMRLQDCRLLSSKDLEFLCMHIFDCPSSSAAGNGMSDQQPELEPKKVNMVLYTHVSECRRIFWGRQQRASRMVASALSKFNETAEPHYRLHVICGVNELVSGPEFSLDITGGYNPWTPHIYLHSHINFLATREGEHATLFFAECKNHDAGTWCVPVSQPKRDDDPDSDMNPDAATDPYAEQVRCIYCEHNGNRIVHPAVSGFHGRDDFVDLFYGSDRYKYNNDNAAQKGLIDWVDELEDDAIHLNFVPDEEGSNYSILFDSQISTLCFVLRLYP